jgi:hypothetical protein
MAGIGGLCGKNCRKNPVCCRRFCGILKQGDGMQHQQRSEAELPLSFGMSLARNTTALLAFSRLDQQQRQSVLDGAMHIHSRQEMDRYVAGLTEEKGKT